MRLSAGIVATVVLFAWNVAAGLSAHPDRVVIQHEGETSGRYIVTLKANADVKTTTVASLPGITKKVDYSNFHAFSANLNADALNALLASDSVESVEQDGLMYALVVQRNAPWGLQRISQRAKLSNTDVNALTYTYTYDDNPGAGVDIYVVDTGIYTAHTQFGGRAIWGATFGGYKDADGNGHGTHCAGTAAGSQFGVAKSANLVAVKVLSDEGKGAISDIISGLNYVMDQMKSTHRPSIVSMSLGGSASPSLDMAVAGLTSAGIHVVVAAGNEDIDAGSTSPARAPSAITVGAITIVDSRASFSNYGSVLDVFAPGEDIISAWIGSPTATKSISGTSMAAPHVAGLVAYLLGKNGASSPAQMSSLVQSLAVSGALQDIPPGTVNLLIQNFKQSNDSIFGSN